MRITLEIKCPTCLSDSIKKNDIKVDGKQNSLGVEYVYGEREAFAPAANGSKKGEDNRVNLVAIYNF